MLAPYVEEDSLRRLRLRDRQLEVFRDPHRFRIVVAGRRFGKTYLAQAEMLAAGLAEPDQRCAHIFPTLVQGKDIAWDSMKDLARPYASKINETTSDIVLVNGSKLSIRGAEKPDSLRGRGYHFVVLDEYPDHKEETWTHAIRPALTSTNGRALFVSTPKGTLNHFYDLVLAAEDDPDWKIWQFTTIDGGNVPQAEIDAARRATDERTFRQEYEATWESLGGRVYYSFDRREPPDGNLLAVEDSCDQLLVGMDFNVDPMSACLGVRAGDELHIFDEIEIPGSSTEEMAAEIVRRYGQVLRCRYRDHRGMGCKYVASVGSGEVTCPVHSQDQLKKQVRRVRVCPDASGGGRRTSAPVGETDFTILKRAGFEVKVPRANPAVPDRINNVNAMLKSAEGRRRLLVHPRCKRLIRCLDGLTYKKGTSQPDKGSGLDHMVDALGYLVCEEFPIVSRRVAALSTVGYFGR